MSRDNPGPVKRTVRMGGEVFNFPIQQEEYNRLLWHSAVSEHPHARVLLTAEEREAIIEENKRRGTYHLLRLKEAA